MFRKDVEERADGETCGDGSTPGAGQDGPARTAPDHGLLDRARDLIRAGGLPSRSPDRIWGGPGCGNPCPVCNAPVRRNEVEMELEFTREAAVPAVLHVHLDCFSALEHERKALDAAEAARLAAEHAQAPASGDPPHARPPFDRRD